MVEGGRVGGRVNACMARAMDENVTNEADHPELEREVDDSDQTWYITWRTEQEGERNQGLILQPVSGNGAGRKGKGEIETRHGGKERPNMSALKLIARQGADEKAQLEEWKASLMEDLTSEITQLQKSHEEAMEAQREEMERQRNHFLFEIEMLGERIRELEEKRGGSTEGHTENGKRPTPDPNTYTPEMEREVTLPPSDMSAIPNLAGIREKVSDNHRATHRLQPQNQYETPNNRGQKSVMGIKKQEPPNLYLLQRQNNADGGFYLLGKKIVSTSQKPT